MTTRLVLDTDIGSDVDDALALAFALRHPDLELAAVTTVSGDTRLRARLAARLIELHGGGGDIEVAGGIGGFMDRNWGGHEGQGVDGLDRMTCSERDGVEVLAHHLDGDTALAVVGMQTNVAAALDRSGRLDVPVVAVMGGVFGGGFPPAHDHNLVVDPESAVRALNAGLPTVITPCDVTFRTALRPKHLDALRRGDGLCRALATMAEIWQSRWGDDQLVARLHDPLAVATLTEGGRGLVDIERLPVTVAMHPDGHVRTFVDPLEGHEMDVVRRADVDAFADYWLEIVRTR